MNDQILCIGDFVIDTCNLFGQGAYGKVFVASRKGDLKQYCAKIIPGNSQNVQQELNILNFMKEKQNDNIVNVYYRNFIPERRLFVIIMERCDSDLEQEIKQKFKDIQNRRDIKPANILIHQGKYKIADFGVGKIYSADQNLLYLTKSGTPAYKAPELQENYEYSQIDLKYIQGNTNFNPNQTYSNIQNPFKGFNQDKEIKQKLMHNVDIYSFGILFYHLLTESFPFKQSMDGIQEFIKNIKQAPFRMTQQLNISQNTCQLIERMITYSPVQRIDFPAISQIFGIKLGNVYNKDHVIINLVKPPQLIMPQSIRQSQYKSHYKICFNNIKIYFMKNGIRSKQFNSCENNSVVKIYRNYCDLCLAVVIQLLEDKINLDLIKDYINKYQQANKSDIQFQFEVKMDKIFYVNEYCRVLQCQFIPKIFEYAQIKSYGEQHLKFMLISQKLIKGLYNHQAYLTNQYPNYLLLKEQLQKDFNLTKEQYKQQLDELF